MTAKRQGRGADPLARMRDGQRKPEPIIREVFEGLPKTGGRDGEPADLHSPWDAKTIAQDPALNHASRAKEFVSAFHASLSRGGWAPELMDAYAWLYWLEQVANSGGLQAPNLAGADVKGLPSSGSPQQRAMEARSELNAAVGRAPRSARRALILVLGRPDQNLSSIAEGSGEYNDKGRSIATFKATLTAGLEAVDEYRRHGSGGR